MKADDRSYDSGHVSEMSGWEAGGDLEDLIRGLDEAAEDLAGIAAAYEAGEQARRVPAEGSDPDEAFTILVDEDRRVQEVRPHSDWRNRIAADSVGPAVMAAIEAALVQQLEAGKEAVDNAERTGRRVEVDRPPEFGTPAVDLFSLQSELSAVFDTLEQVDLDVESLRRSEEPADPVEDPDSIGEQRVTVRLTSTGDVASVAVNPRWAEKASRSGLAEQILEALHDAYSSYQPSAPQSTLQALQVSPEVQAVIDNPAAAFNAYLRAY